MNDPDGRSFDGKLQRAEDAEATTGSPLTGAAPGTYVDPTTGKVTQYQGAARPGDIGSQLYSALLGSLNTPVNAQGQPLPVTDAATGYAPAGGPGRFTVTPEDLRTFASRMQDVHDYYFDPSTSNTSGFRGGAQLGNVQLGPLADGATGSLNGTFDSFKQQLFDVLQELRQLVGSLADKSNASQVTYQDIEDRIAQTMRSLGNGTPT